MLDKGEGSPGLSIAGGSVFVWDFRNADERPRRLGRHEAAVTSLAFDPAGDILASASDDKTIRLWRPGQSMDSITILRGHENSVVGLGFTQDGQFLASAGADCLIRLWDMRRPVGAPKILRGHEEAVLSIAFSPDSRMIASVDGSEAAVRLWDLDRGMTRTSLHIAKGKPVSVIFDPERAVVVSGSEGDVVDRESALQLWDLRNRGKSDSLLPHPYKSSIRFLAIGSTGRRLASAGQYDQEVVVWNMAQLGKPEVVLRTEPRANICSLAFSPSESELVAACADRTLRIWDFRRQTKDPVILMEHVGLCRCVVFSPDGRAFFSGDEIGTLCRWNSETVESRGAVLGMCDGKIHSLAVSASGTLLASASSDGKVRVWNLTSPSADAIVLPGPGADVYAVGFSPNERWLAAGGSDKTVVVWPSTEALADMVCEKVSRNLSKEEWSRFIARDIPYERTCPDLPAPQN
jgi:WD40 repeat protein